MHLLCLLRAPIVLDKAHTLAHYQGDCASWVDFRVDFSLVWIGATFDHKVRFPQSSLDLWKSRFAWGFVSGLEIAPLTSNLCSMVQQRWTCSKLAVVTIKICFKTTMGNSLLITHYKVVDVDSPFSLFYLCRSAKVRPLESVVLMY